MRLLGPVEVTGPGGVLRLPGARPRAVVALLGLRAPGVVSRPELVDALWGADPPPTAVKTLHSHIARIRRSLSDLGCGELLVTREPGYALDLDPPGSDLAVFEGHVRAGRCALRDGDAAAAAGELRAGLALWRGDPLADCPVAEWGHAEVARLDEARAAAAELLVEAELALGEHDAAAGELERLVRRYPFRERCWEFLVIAHHRGGRQGEALRAYRRAREVLLDELGLEPGPRLRRLEADVLAGVAELDPATAPRTGSGPATPAAPVLSAPATRVRGGDAGTALSARDERSAMAQPVTPGFPRGAAPVQGGWTAVVPGGLVGREREHAEVLTLLTRSRLVTLTGPGGCGKTSLALSVTAALAGHRRVVPVDLTPTRVPELVADAVATAVGVPEQPGVDRVDGLVGALAADSALILLDNCEHLLPACVDLVGRLLASCPGVAVLVTSREALRVPGEVACPVPPLAVPDPDVPRSLAELSAYDAVRLFLDRAAEHGQRFGDEDAVPIARLCATLDGLPLGLELAAARTPVLSPAQIARRLRDRFGLLTYSARTGAPAHHRTLRAAVAWSHDLLSPDEAALFARLGVFAGGFAVEAVEAVWEADRALDALTGLLAKSLVRVRREEACPRFSVLETIAAYAGERLADDPAAEAEARERHARHYARLAEEAAADGTGVLLRDLRVEHENLRLAVSWFVEAADPTAALDLAAALSRYCRLHGRYRDGRRWLDQALAGSAGAPPGPRSRALAGAASLALSECDYAQASARAAEGLDLAAATDDHWLVGRLRVLLGNVARERGEYAEALHHYRTCRDSFRACANRSGIAYSHQLAGATAWLAGDPDPAREELRASLAVLRELDDRRGAASSLAYLGAVALGDGRLDEARELLEEALDVFGQFDFKEGLAWALNLLGLVEHRAGRPGQADELLRASLALHRELGDRWREASVLEALAAVACALGEADRGAGLVHRAEVIRDAIGAPVPAVERPALAETRAAISAAGA